ncbi:MULTISPECIES: hypothetical protein [Nocardia]|uniref:hypothetical protein n=1 Tax=Nocardia TaxID=1817 RepID=UPI000D69F567|nr:MULTISPECIES: hypothetical protein [Nocardia]
MNDINEVQGCRVGLELTCAGCGQVVSCHREGFDYILRELLEQAELGFGQLLSALVLSGWDITVHQLVVGDFPRVIVMGTPVDRDGRADLTKSDVTAIWERRPEGWVAGTNTTGFQRISGGAFRPESALELAGLVTQSPAVWSRVPARR